MNTRRMFESFIAGLVLLVWCGAAWAIDSVPFDDKPKDGAKCVYTEKRKSGGGPRTFLVQCGATDEKGAYECAYTGNPHGCTWYNKNQGKFYEHLSKIAARYKTACSARNLEHRKKCSGYVFKRDYVKGGKKKKR